MLYDLQGEPNMTPIVGILYSTVKENSQRLQLITNDMTQEEVDYKGPNHEFNSTAQLLRHIMYVDLNWVYRIRDIPLSQLLISQYGPMIDANNRLPMIEGKSLNTLMSEYEIVLITLKNACTQLIDDDLGKIVTFGHGNEKQATIRWGLWHMADHSRYHQAHINQLRKWYQENSLSK
ncbi:DinB family protein [Paenibacillus endoradicis]|uniref:DinB family protein n=1 Tax=Paenibacillus endoradicis TaxID=2972487 RepID=UPI002158A29E|nr:DinB family protein [Paenibacillus endoradicis]MCR8656665.1 DinB family protein [Paenibacillus endoradicis]